MIKISTTNTSQIKDGKWKEFNKHAVLVTEGFYVNNKKHGTWKQYYDHTGTILIEENFNHGVKHGQFTSYHPNGQVFSQGEYQHGLREGYFRVYDEKGNNIRNLLFIKNIEIEDITNEQAFSIEGKTENGS
jgi:antitoxin component YwqK of YwqJK toxin-antitoxin module